MKVSLQEDVLVWNFCICCVIQTENLFQFKNPRVFGGVEKHLLNLIFPCIQTVDSIFFPHGQ